MQSSRGSRPCGDRRGPPGDVPDDEDVPRPCGSYFLFSKTRGVSKNLMLWKTYVERRNQNRKRDVRRDSGLAFSSPLRLTCGDIWHVQKCTSAFKLPQTSSRIGMLTHALALHLLCPSSGSDHPTSVCACHVLTSDKFQIECTVLPSRGAGWAGDGTLPRLAVPVLLVYRW